MLVAVRPFGPSICIRGLFCETSEEKLACRLLFYASLFTNTKQNDRTNAWPAKVCVWAPPCIFFIVLQTHTGGYQDKKISQKKKGAHFLKAF